MLGLLAVGGSLARIPAQLTDIYPPNIAFDFSPDGATLAGAGFSSLHIWSVSEARQVRAIVQWGTNDLAWSADGKRLVAVGSSGEGSITSWDPMTGAKLESLPGTIGEVTDVAFSRDGTRMATSSDDGTIRLWHGDRLEQIMILATDAKGSLAFTTDGTRLAYTAADGMVRVLALRTSDLVELARSRLAGVR
jgi:WD40 repeat protein